LFSNQKVQKQVLSQNKKYLEQKRKPQKTRQARAAHAFIIGRAFVFSRGGHFPFLWNHKHKQTHTHLHSHTQTRQSQHKFYANEMMNLHDYTKNFNNKKKKHKNAFNQ